MLPEWIIRFADRSWIQSSNGCKLLCRVDPFLVGGVGGEVFLHHYKTNADTETSMPAQGIAGCPMLSDTMRRLRNSNQGLISTRHRHYWRCGSWSCLLWLFSYWRDYIDMAALYKCAAYDCYPARRRRRSVSLLVPSGRQGPGKEMIMVMLCDEHCLVW